MFTFGGGFVVEGGSASPPNEELPLMATIPSSLALDVDGMKEGGGILRESSEASTSTTRKDGKEDPLSPPNR